MALLGISARLADGTRGGEEKGWWKRLRSRYLRSHRIPILSPLLIVIPGLR